MQFCGKKDKKSLPGGKKDLASGVPVGFPFDPRTTGHPSVDDGKFPLIGAEYQMLVVLADVEVRDGAVPVIPRG